MWTRESLAYVAGLLEGEGTFGAWSKRGVRRLRIAVSMTDVEPLHQCQQVTGLGRVNGPYQPTYRGAKPYWIWQIQAWHQVQALMAAVYPWMSPRRKQQILRALEQHGLPIAPTTPEYV